MQRKKRSLSMSFLALVSLLAVMTTLKAQVKDQYMRVSENKFPKTEKMIDVGSGRILDCKIYGQGSPTIVLVSGFSAPQSYWDGILPFLLDKATVVTYDRPGIGKSSKGDLPLDGGQSAKDLHALLEKMDVPEPYIVVGHSLGVSIVRLFVSMYPENVGGLILEDGSPESLLDEQLKILKGKDLQALQEAVSKISRPADPQNEADFREETDEQLRKSGPLPPIPFVVITSGDRSKNVPPIFSEQARRDLIKLGMDLQQRLVDLIPGGKHIVAEGVGHNIHVEKPAILVDPLVEIINRMKSMEKSL